MKYTYLIMAISLLATSSCSNKKIENNYNETASISDKDSLSFNPLEWKLINSSINKNTNTMCTLYGNNIAVDYARTGKQNNYPNGSQLSLVTWAQKEDGHWFGGNIPGIIKSVELIEFDTVKNNLITPSYKNYEGSPLKLNKEINSQLIAERINYVTSQKASVIP